MLSGDQIYNKKDYFQCWSPLERPQDIFRYLLTLTYYFKQYEADLVNSNFAGITLVCILCIAMMLLQEINILGTFLIADNFKGNSWFSHVMNTITLNVKTLLSGFLQINLLNQMLSNDAEMNTSVSFLSKDNTSVLKIKKL